MGLWPGPAGFFLCTKNWQVGLALVFPKDKIQNEFQGSSQGELSLNVQVKSNCFLYDNLNFLVVHSTTLSRCTHDLDRSTCVEKCQTFIMNTYVLYSCQLSVVIYCGENGCKHFLHHLHTWKYTFCIINQCQKYRLLHAHIHPPLCWGINIWLRPQESHN